MNALCMQLYFQCCVSLTNVFCGSLTWLNKFFSAKLRTGLVRVSGFEKLTIEPI